MRFAKWSFLIQNAQKPLECALLACVRGGLTRVMRLGVLLSILASVGLGMQVMAEEPDGQTLTPLSDFVEVSSHPFVIRETYQAKPSDGGKPANSSGIVGLDMQIRTGGYPLVQGVFHDTPAERQGVQAGDLILAVNGQSTLGESAEAVDAMISDVPGDVVTLQLRRRQAVRTVRLTVMAWASASPELRQDYAFWGPDR